MTKYLTPKEKHPLYIVGFEGSNKEFVDILVKEPVKNISYFLGCYAKDFKVQYRRDLKTKPKLAKNLLEVSNFLMCSADFLDDPISLDKHPKQTKFKKRLDFLASSAANMRYDRVANLTQILIEPLSERLFDDLEVSKDLYYRPVCFLSSAHERLKEAWRISKPKMETY